MIRFTALKDFHCEETHSDYVAGMGYNIDNEKLASRVEKWLGEGKVEISGRHAQVTAKGYVWPAMSKEN